MVATNEFEDAWLDEGINSYTEAIVTGAILGRQTSAFDRPWANLADIDLHYLEYIAMPDYDPVTRNAWQFRNANSYGGVTYGKTSLLLATLEGIIGRDTMAEAMQTYFMRYRFQHPTAEDFLHTIEEVAIKRGRATGIFGKQTPSQMKTFALPGPFPVPQNPQIMISSSLRPYFNQAVYGTNVLDYSVEAISSDPAKWWLPDSKEKTLQDTVTIHRMGDFILPVTLEVAFSDGTRIREIWDPSGSANDRWKTFTYQRDAKIVSAEIDPDHTVLLDTNRFNNSRTVEANGVPARKLTNLWMSWLQLTSQLAGWLV